MWLHSGSREKRFRFLATKHRLLQVSQSPCLSSRMRFFFLSSMRAWLVAGSGDGELIFKYWSQFLHRVCISNMTPGHTVPLTSRVHSHNTTLSHISYLSQDKLIPPVTGNTFRKHAFHSYKTLTTGALLTWWTILFKVWMIFFTFILIIW